MVLMLMLSMVACGASEPAETKAPEAAAHVEGEAAAPAVAEKKELKKFTLGLMDPGAWNAAYGPVMDQIEALKEDLNFKTIYATRAGSSTDDVLAAIQNLIVSGAPCCLRKTLHADHPVLHQLYHCLGPFLQYDGGQP